MTAPTAPPTSPNEAGLLGRLSPGAWAVADQGLFAGANFLLNILLARWLPPATYGAMVVGLAVLFALGAMHVAVLGEPLLVFGAGHFAGRRRAYLGAVMAGHWVVAAGVLAAMLAAGTVTARLGSADLGVALAGLGLCSPFVLLLWLARRVCYLLQQPRWAAAAGGAYLVLMLAAMALLRRWQWVTLPTALAVIGGCSAVVSVGLVILLRPDYRDVNLALLREAAAVHLRYGRWSVATNAMFFLSGQAVLVLAGALLGLQASGLLRAIANLITPMHLISTAVATQLVPTLVRTERDVRKRAMWRPLLLLSAVAAGYWLVLGILQRPLFELVYGGQYMPAAHLVWALGLTVVSGAAADITAAALRAGERPDLVFRCFAGATLITVVGGPILISTWAVSGAVVVMALSSAAAAAGLLVSARRVIA